MDGRLGSSKQLIVLDCRRSRRAAWSPNTLLLRSTLPSCRRVHDNATNPKDARVLVLCALANRNEQKYADPNRFDVKRNPRDHVGWGLRPHTCIGMHLSLLDGNPARQPGKPGGDNRDLEPRQLRNNVLQGLNACPQDSTGPHAPKAATMRNFSATQSGPSLAGGLKHSLPRVRDGDSDVPSMREPGKFRFGGAPAAAGRTFRHPGLLARLMVWRNGPGFDHCPWPNRARDRL